MTGDQPIMLDEMERDALTELVNIGVSRAASSLRIMVGREILLAVPDVAILPRRQAARIIGDHEQARLVAVLQDFEGDFAGRAILIFPETNSLELVRAVTGGTLPPEDIEALEQAEIKRMLWPVVEEILPAGWMPPEAEFHVNPTGKFVIGGPDGPNPRRLT